MLRMELDLAFLAWIRAPGEHLSVLDSFSDLKENMRRVGANATFAGANPQPVTGDEGMPPKLDLERTRRVGELLESQGAYAPVTLGDHNNPWFPFFPEDYQERYPDAFMRDAEGRIVHLRDKTRREGRGIPMPALDALPILEYSSRCIREGVALLKDNPYISSWVIGSEEGYTDFLIGPMGDFRPDSWHHFQEWLKWQGQATVPTIRDVVSRQSQATWSAWLHYREQAMADRAAWHLGDFLRADGIRPVFYPTHGSPFWGDSRWRLAQPASVMIGACDGLEMGHIPVDDDDERSNMLIFAHFSSFGAPLMVPRLGNRTVDFHARGMGRSFTPVMLRRLVYESLGMGAWHIGPIHWSSVLHDGEWFIRDTPAEPECRAVFAEILGAADVLLGMGRLQPQVGLYASDEAWLERWNPRWTGFFQDALGAHWNTGIFTDAHLSGGFVRATPVLVSIDNARISRSALGALTRYVAAGGRVVVNGSFGVQDEAGNPHDPAAMQSFLSRPGVTVVRETGAAEQRRLVTESLSHTQGSHRVVQDYVAAPFPQIDAAVRGYAPSAVAVPVVLEDEMPLPSNVNVFTLTDRVSLLCVLVNNAERYTSMLVKPHPSLRSSETGWVFYDAVRKERLGAGDSARVQLARNDSALVWIAPAAAAEETDRTISGALEAMEAWSAEGCDTAFLRHAVDGIRRHGEGQLPRMKAACLARAVLESVCLKTAVVRGGGSLRVEVTPRDHAMMPVLDCVITMRLIPDRYRRLELRHEGNGVYARTLAKEELPRFYDPRARRYLPFEGPARIVVQAESGRHHAGGAQLLVGL